MNLITCDHQVVLARHWKQRVCGDLFLRQDTRSASTLILADGQGKGVEAHLWGSFFVQRLSLTLKRGFSLRHAIRQLVQEDDSHCQDPQTAFHLVRILSDGRTSVISRNMPPALYWPHRKAPTPLLQTPMAAQPDLRAGFLIREPHDRLLCCSDGAVQACKNRSQPEGWGIDGICGYLKNRNGSFPAARALVAHLYGHSQGRLGDDTSCLDLQARIRSDLHIWIGAPPITRGNLEQTAFWSQSGRRVIIGLEAADAWARTLGLKPYLNEDSRYCLPGVDLILRRPELLDLYGPQSEEDSQMRTLSRWIRTSDTVGLHTGTPTTGPIKTLISGLTTKWQKEGRTWWTQT